MSRAVVHVSGRAAALRGRPGVGLDVVAPLFEAHRRPGERVYSGPALGWVESARSEEWAALLTSAATAAGYALCDCPPGTAEHLEGDLFHAAHHCPCACHKTPETAPAGAEETVQ